MLSYKIQDMHLLDDFHFCLADHGDSAFEHKKFCAHRSVNCIPESRTSHKTCHSLSD